MSFTKKYFPYLNLKICLKSFIYFFVIPSILFLSSCKDKKKEAVKIENNSILEKKFNDYYRKIPKLKKLSKNKVYHLKAYYIEDNELPSLKTIVLKKIFKRTSQLAKKYLGYTIKIELLKRIDIYTFFKNSEYKFSKSPYNYIPSSWYIPLNQSDTYSKTLKAVRQAIQGKDPKLLEEYFGEAGKNSDIGKHVTNTFFIKLNNMFKEKDLKGNNLFQKKRRLHFSYAHWDCLAFQEKEADLLISNTLLTGPDTGMPLYVIARGGVTSAFIENNKFRPLQGVGVFALYQFLSDGSFFTKHRGVLTHAEKMEVISFMWTHELGHLLARKKENYTLSGSIHKTAIDLKYLEWVNLVKEKHFSIKKKIPTLNKY